MEPPSASNSDPTEDKTGHAIGPDDALRGAAHPRGSIEPPKRADLSPDQQSAFDKALRSGIEQKDNHLIELALNNGADPNILMFAGIAYTTSFVKAVSLDDLEAIHARESMALREIQQKRRRSLKGLFLECYTPKETIRNEDQAQVDLLKARHQKEREDYNRGFEWLQLAVKFGADVNAANPDEKDRDGIPYPAIHCAYTYFRKDTSDFLMAHGAAVDTPSPVGNTLLMRSVLDGLPRFVRYYLSMGADPMRFCAEQKSFPLKKLQDSDKFTKENKAELLTLMMENVRRGAIAAASAVGLLHEMKLKKPLVLKSTTAKPPRPFNP